MRKLPLLSLLVLAVWLVPGAAVASVESTATESVSESPSPGSPTTSEPSSSPSPTSSPPAPTTATEPPAGDEEPTTIAPSTSSPPTSGADSTSQVVTLDQTQWVEFQIFAGALLFFTALSTLAAFGSKGRRD